MKESFEIMPDQEHYSLRWNNHQNHILRAFDTLLQTKTLVDVTLVCAETSIRAHKVVLSACSPFFQRVFSETPCKHPVIVLKDFRGWVVQAIVDFMYRGEISVPQERLSVLIQAGESLQVRGLVDHPVAANTPTPAQSPEDFSLLDSSLISPTSPSLPSPNFQTSHQSGQLRHHPTAATGLISSNTPKLLLPPQVFADPSISLPSASVDPLTTSPPTTTTTTTTTAALTTTNNDERRSRSLHKLSPRKTSSSKGGSAGLLLQEDDLHAETAPVPPSESPPVADGPENLCMKKSSPNSSELIRNIAGGGVGDQRNRIASIDGSDNNTVSSETNDRTACRDDTARLPPDGSKDISPLSDTIGGGHMSSRGLLSLKDIRHLNRAALNRSLGSISPPPSFASLNNNLHPALSLMHHHHNHHHHHHHGESKRVKLEDREDERSLLHDDLLEPPHFLDHMDLALSTHQHPLAHHLAHQHHLRNASPHLRPPTADGHGHGGPDNNTSNSGNKQNNSGNSSNNNNGSAGANNHSSILNQQHHSNPNNKHHHPSGGGGVGRPGTPKHSSGLGSNNNNNNNVGSNSTSSSNSNSLHHGHHPHHHPHNGPKGSAGGPKDFLHSPTLNFPPFFNHSEGPPRPTHSPLPFPHMPSVSSLTLTPPHSKYFGEIS
uniref:BTB domain-containing protein n=1 Tax=Anopheles maculatus TaxID=74869 RepID=A0A182SLB6_9DIPT